MNIKDASSLWNISTRRISELCKVGRITGAYKQGKKWFIPDNAEKPIDNRRTTSELILTSPTTNYKPLPIGVSDYCDACSNYYYVDKTLLIKDLLDERAKVSLFTRPRRFGKTLNMDMLRVFFERSEKDTSVYFKDKKIWQYGKRYTQYQGKFPVIYLTFKDVKCANWQETLKKLRALISLEFTRHCELETSTALNVYEKQQYLKIVNQSADDIDYQMSLQLLSLYLHKHWNKEAIIIIDEYDIPIQQGHLCGFHNETINFMRNFFSGGLKDNSHLALGLLTGILRIAKESLFSGLYNLKINSILDDRYSEYFGFTPKEVQEMSKYYNATDKYQEICEWYDGYHFGNTDIFNPWSVIEYFNNKCQPKAFWLSTSSNDIIKEVLENATPEIIEHLEILMKSGSFITRIDTGVIYPELQNNPSSAYSFLLVAGYLKVISCNSTYSEDYLCEVAIPNKEISFAYSKEILSQFKDFIPKSSADTISNAMIMMDEEALQNSLEKFLLQTISYHDTASESFYHSLILGMCAITDSSYKISSNREVGNGRFDIQMLPLNQKLPGVLIELKTAKNVSESRLKELAQIALDQINDRKYEVELSSLDLNSIIKIGIAFSGKQVKLVSEKQTKH